MNYKNEVSKAFDELETMNAGGDSYRALINDGWAYNTGVKPVVLPPHIDLLNRRGDLHTDIELAVLDWSQTDEYTIVFWRPSKIKSIELPINKDVTEDTLSKMTGQSEPEITKDIMNEGRKDDSGKIRLSLLPKLALKEVMSVLEHGAVKYGAENWRKLDNLQDRYTDSAFRHLLSDSLGEDIDVDSEHYHLACAITGLMFKLEDKLLEAENKQ